MGGKKSVKEGGWESKGKTGNCGKEGECEEREGQGREEESREMEDYGREEEC